VLLAIAGTLKTEVNGRPNVVAIICVQAALFKDGRHEPEEAAQLSKLAAHIGNQMGNGCFQHFLTYQLALK